MKKISFLMAVILCCFGCLGNLVACQSNQEANPSTSLALSVKNSVPEEQEKPNHELQIQEYDSIKISAEEKNKIDNGYYSFMIKIYHDVGLLSFENQTIEGIIASKEYLCSYMMKQVMESDIDIIYKDRINEDEFRISSYSHWEVLAEYALHPEYVFEPSVEIYNTYCLGSGGGYDEIFVYYRTSIGDYVLYCDRPPLEPEYLIPISDFVEIAKACSAYVEYLSTQPPMEGGYLMEHFYDASQFAFTPRVPVD